jgi:pimeloyl-ACP methyl ester carboxylesterase
MHSLHLVPTIALCVLSCAAQSSTPTLADFAALGTAWETSQHANPDLSWYETPANFSSDLQPGRLLKIEYDTDLTNYTVPHGLSMSRIIYTTLDVHGSVLPASAYILWPYQSLPANDTLGYDFALWAHGTTGLFQPCAPSNYRSLQYHFMVPYLLANQGIAVLAADYVGLGVSPIINGSRIHHPWATAPAQANDLAYAITAARTAFPQYLAPAGPFVTIGHSEGGKTAWGFAERQFKSAIPGYRGTVALAPVGDTIAIIEQALEYTNTSWSNAAGSLADLAIPAITSVYASYNNAGFTNVTAASFAAESQFQACLPTRNLLYGTIPDSEIAKPGWTSAPEVRAWQNLTTVGNKPFAGPLLILAGDNDGSDAVIPFDGPFSSSILSTTHKLCDMMEQGGWGQSLEVVGYKNANHFTLIQASENRWLTWVKDRLNGATTSPPSGCAFGKQESFRDSLDPLTGTAPNFLVEWVNATDSWQYTL